MEISPQPSTSYVYLLQEREFVKTSENIYKIGRTKKENFTRFNQYPKGSILLFQIICQNDELVEDLILKQFKLFFEHQLLIGREYFKGDFRIMIDMMHTIVKNEMTPTEMQQLKMEKVEMARKLVAAELQKKRKRAIDTQAEKNLPIEQWLEHLTRQSVFEEKETVKLLVSTACNMLKAWCALNSLEYIINAVQLGQQLKYLEIPGITKTRTNAGIVIVCNIEKLKAHFNIVLSESDKKFKAELVNDLDFFK